MDNDRQGSSGDGRRQQRGAERRVHTGMTPPPYQTFHGLVTLDRRSAVDRRATWIREFSLETLPDTES